MAPAIIEDHAVHEVSFKNKEASKEATQQRYPEPLKLSGALNHFKHEDTTPIIGREFIGVNIVDDLLNGENADERLRDIAITISQRGVVFFRAQDNLTDALQKEFVHKLGLLSGKPKDSNLHTHPVLNNTSEFGVGDAEISTISSLARKKLFKHELEGRKRHYDSAQWHSDIQFEPKPADYTSLRLTQLPSSGGDTLWASGYELYDRFSKPYRTFLEGLTATFSGDGFLKAAAANPEQVKIHEGPRGAPENVGAHLTSVHPVVRTNPVTGWKSLFAVGPFPKYINELDSQESEELLALFKRRIHDSHDLTVRFKWRNENDIAIWDNRSAFHTATFDYEGLGERFGHRAVGIGEAPYLDPNSTLRSESLAHPPRRAINNVTTYSHGNTPNMSSTPGIKPIPAAKPAPIVLPPAKPIEILHDDYSFLASNVHAAVLLSGLVLSFNSLVQDPIRTLVRLAPLVIIIQLVYCFLCLPSTGQAPPPPKQKWKKQSKPTQDFGARAVPAFLSLILTITLTVPAVFILVIFFGAPLTTHQAHTILLSLHLGLLTTPQLFYVHGLDVKVWMQAASLQLPLDEVYGMTLGALVGAWAGAVPIPLDWDREWQKYPITIVAGLYIGAVTGKLLGAYVVKGVRAKIN
ncbi:hypothetical protein Q7P35_006232 [Cladosporium inversicolor]